MVNDICVAVTQPNGLVAEQVGPTYGTRNTDHDVAVSQVNLEQTHLQ